MAWEAYLQIEPCGDDRLDWLFAGIREMIHNIAVERKHQKPVRDFLLKFEETEKKPQTWQDKLWIAQMWVDSWNEQIDKSNSIDEQKETRH